MQVGWQHLTQLNATRLATSLHMADAHLSLKERSLTMQASCTSASLLLHCLHQASKQLSELQLPWAVVAAVVKLPMTCHECSAMRSDVWA